MADRHIDKVKNLVLVGQGGVGKTMLAESMLHLSGKTTRLGGHAGTRPTLDYDEEEVRTWFFYFYDNCSCDMAGYTN